MKCIRCDKSAEASIDARGLCMGCLAKVLQEERMSKAGDVVVRAVEKLVVSIGEVLFVEFDHRGVSMDAMRKFVTEIEDRLPGVRVIAKPSSAKLSVVRADGKLVDKTPENQ